ncbi:PP2C family protein-serine/threonine phosphatase [Clostridium perfringens]|uniref:PP2C family protein-serine/threonine phosphatase n=2 Tax=Clostridium perfringens TaxID=1502 RepID=UPI0018E4ACC5|nr:protein phosphatase 2C domain-containing protein [Clostridium perfringens]MBI6001991.1 serine/threonine-protein phosphatase [Clostridium perfringens]MDK0918463.1 protein phosphatase 2C domain-containing protein [Clostridium perfringens]MDZ4906790.1 SpoIIE family protein phosphatase [Clostridium perfringens]
MFRAYGVTNTGKVRAHNEDSYLVNGDVKSEGSIFIDNAKEIFVAVADGMGGAEGGEIASNLVLRNLKDSLIILEERAINKDINIINDRILEATENNIGRVGMGSTLVAIKVIDDKSAIINVGDSRVYLYRDGFIRQLTKDHTLVQQLYELGVIERDEMKTHSKSHFLTQCIGGRKKSIIEPQVILNRKFIEGDILILCSDGLYNKINEDNLEDLIGKSNDIRDIGDKLINLANELGGDDNITAVLVQVI